MYVNVIGHVKNPGIYLVYDGIDYMSLLSLAGGYLPGSNLKNITLYSENGSHQKINLIDIYKSTKNRNEVIKFKPHDTLYIKESFSSKIFTSSNLPALFLSFLNIALTLERTK